MYDKDIIVYNYFIKFYFINRTLKFNLQLSNLFHLKSHDLILNVTYINETHHFCATDLIIHHAFKSFNRNSSMMLHTKFYIKKFLKLLNKQISNKESLNSGIQSRQTFGKAF